MASGSVIKTNVLKSKQGSVLIYVLVIVNCVMQWVTWRLSHFNESLNSKKSLLEIHERLDCESQILEYFSSNEDDFSSFVNDSWVEASKNDEKISVLITGKMSYSFEYAIIEDGSFKLKTAEENYDFIK